MGIRKAKIGNHRGGGNNKATRSYMSVRVSNRSAFKYFGVDERYVSGNIFADDMVFYRQFPVPGLKDAHHIVVNACKSNVYSCVEEIYNTAKDSGTLSLLRNGDPNTPIEAPFATKLEMFRYKTTAFYYLCWHTLNKEEAVAYRQFDQKCLDGLSKVAEAKSGIKPSPVDIREEELKYSRYSMTCALLWFCPDPCFGRQSGGSVPLSVYRDPKSDVGNPCKSLPSATCSWKMGANLNFDGLIKNKFNISCDCESERKGFIWNSQYGLCIDKDECYDGEYTCPNDQVCRNTVGGYMCTCHRGYSVNQTTKLCERLPIFHPSISKLKSLPLRKNYKESFGFSSIIESLLQLSKSAHIHLNPLLQTIFLLVSLMMM
ncbi:hypothetical protein CHS0354_022279 [Potamilus streckersoni]|uniref:EGF-like domain-containing protein n=1 Tax=Potamilus streckersoni TaxID=2493646 RepID=A0AAE0THW1_9BIVA|nr:hypothetical protein CHS0354_022279 [Potamilus streckersoni]